MGGWHGGAGASSTNLPAVDGGAGAANGPRISLYTRQNCMRVIVRYGGRRRRQQPLAAPFAQL